MIDHAPNTHPEEDRVFERLLEFLRQARGFDFTGYKRSSLKRRVRKQMQIREIESFGDYLDYLEVHPEEFVPLFNTILINVTTFFRDFPAWEYLRDRVIPRILEGKVADEPIRIWSAGCASGEEAYSLAILISETIGFDQFRARVKIYATDVDEEALTQARHAIYSKRMLEAIPDLWQGTYFERSNGNYIFRPDLRRAIIFGRHDLVQDAPISRLDFLVCRNTLMYFNAEMQKRILARFHFALKDTGILFLGKAEMLLTHADLFTPLNLQHRIFQRVPKINLQDRLLVLAQTGDEEAGSRLSSNVRLREAAFNSVPMPQIIIDFNGNLALANLAARSRFGLNWQDLGNPFRDLELSYRPLELRSPIEQVYQERNSILIEDVRRDLPNGQTEYYDIQLTPLRENGSDLIGVSITFSDVSRYHDLRSDLQRSNQELETANEELQSSNEELETTNEELQSTNEELETTNEELQSTNEELETTNEELQSTNEELQTINDELRLRTLELNETNAFLSSILGSLQACVIVVDRQFEILSWNESAEDLWGLRSDEVLGESLLGLDIGLPVAKLRNPIRTCLENQQKPPNELSFDAMNRRGKAIQIRVRLNQLRGHDIKVRGVILYIEASDRSEFQGA